MPWGWYGQVLDPARFKAQIWPRNARVGVVGKHPFPARPNAATFGKIVTEGRGTPE